MIYKTVLLNILMLSLYISIHMQKIHRGFTISAFKVLRLVWRKLKVRKINWIIVWLGLLTLIPMTLHRSGVDELGKIFLKKILPVEILEWDEELWQGRTQEKHSIRPRPTHTVLEMWIGAAERAEIWLQIWNQMIWARGTALAPY